MVRTFNFGPLGYFNEQVRFVLPHSSQFGAEPVPPPVNLCFGYLDTRSFSRTIGSPASFCCWAKPPPQFSPAGDFSDSRIIFLAGGLDPPHFCSLLAKKTRV